MIVQPYDYALLLWFVLAGLSTAYVAYQFANNPEPIVMKWAFIRKPQRGFRDVV